MAWREDKAPPCHEERLATSPRQLTCCIIAGLLIKVCAMAANCTTERRREVTEPQVSTCSGSGTSSSPSTDPHLRVLHDAGKRARVATRGDVRTRHMFGGRHLLTQRSSPHRRSSDMSGMPPAPPMPGKPPGMPGKPPGMPGKPPGMPGKPLPAEGEPSASSGSSFASSAPVRSLALHAAMPSAAAADDGSRRSSSSHASLAAEYLGRGWRGRGSRHIHHNTAARDGH